MFLYFALISFDFMFLFYLHNRHPLNADKLKAWWWKPLGLYIFSFLLFFPLNHLVPLLVVFHTAIMFALFYWYFRIPARQLLFSLVQFFCLLLISYGTAYMTAFFLSTSLTQGDGNNPIFYRNLFLALQGMFALVLVILVVSLKKISEHRLHYRDVFLFVLLPIYQVILFCVYLATSQAINTSFLQNVYIILFLSILVDFIMIFSMNNLIEKIAIEENLSALYTQRQLEMDYYDLTQKHIETMSTLKSDYCTRLHTIKKALEQDTSEEFLAQLLTESKLDISKNSLPRYCENEIVNAVLTTKQQSAIKAAVPMKIKTFIPKKIPITEIDLCSLFCNLLDNAIEACTKVHTIQKKISVKANVAGGFLTVKIENTYENPIKKEHGIFLTTKENKEDHGYGIQLIERIVTRYHGQLTIEHTGNSFSVLAVLEVPKIDN